MDHHSHMQTSSTKQTKRAFTGGGHALEKKGTARSGRGDHKIPPCVKTPDYGEDKVGCGFGACFSIRMEHESSWVRYENRKILANAIWRQQK